MSTLSIARVFSTLPNAGGQKFWYRPILTTKNADGTTKSSLYFDYTSVAYAVPKSLHFQAMGTLRARESCTFMRSSPSANNALMLSGVLRVDSTATTGPEQFAHAGSYLFSPYISWPGHHYTIEAMEQAGLTEELIAWGQRFSLVAARNAVVPFSNDPLSKEKELMLRRAVLAEMFLGSVRENFSACQKELLLLVAAGYIPEVKSSEKKGLPEFALFRRFFDAQGSPYVEQQWLFLPEIFSGYLISRTDAFNQQYALKRDAKVAQKALDDNLALLRQQSKSKTDKFLKTNPVKSFTESVMKSGVVDLDLGLLLRVSSNRAS